MAQQLIHISNNVLSVDISTLGAELYSVKKDGKEYIWNADPAVWGFHAPHVFPICGKLRNDTLRYNGCEYTLGKHGYVRFCEFELEKAESDRVTFLLRSNEESRKMYPFDYELRISYVLDGASVKVFYNVNNKTDGDMYYSIGGHEGYLCPEGINDYTLHFEKSEDFVHTADFSLISPKNILVLENSDVFPLNYDYFKEDSLNFLGLKSRWVRLTNGSRSLRIDYEGFDYLLLWTKSDGSGKYICIEPWNGLPDFEGAPEDFSEKLGISKIAKGESTELCHTITIEE